MIADKNRIYDGWLTLEAGVDAGRTPDQININQVASSENATFRGGKWKTRPGIRKMDESFPNLYSQIFCYGAVHGNHVVGEYTPLASVPAPVPAWFTNQNSEYIYRNGVFQSAIAFSPHGHQDCIIAIIGGRTFQIIPSNNTASITEVVPTSDITPNVRNRQDQPIAYQVQADKWMVVQDGISKPIIYDGFTSRRCVSTSDPNATEIPVGTILASGMGRITTVVNERDIAFGDLFGSHPGPDPGDSLILFTERNFLTEGFDAAIPFDKGVATGASFFPQLDTSTGTGQLLVFSQRGASSFFLSLPRDVWKTSQFQIDALLSTGLRGHRSVSIVNEDLWFRSDDGVRTYRQARSESAGWAHIPLSTNVKQFTDSDTPWLLKYISSMYFDNRVIMTCSPAWNQGRVVHSGLLVMDFDILSSFGVKYKPAWEGHWTMPAGIQISQVLSGTFNNIQRAFIFGIDETGQNQLYELSLDDKTDFDGQVINWEMVMRAFDFQKLSQQSSPFSEVMLYDADIWVSNIDSNATMTSYYKPDNYPDWIFWKDFSQEWSMIGTPQAISIGGVPTIKPGFEPRQSFGKPPDDTDPNSKRNLRRGYQFQPRLVGSGHVVFERFRIHAQKLTEQSTSKV